MFDNDILLAFAFMALLFLRQIFILKKPNKINYAPLMIGIGAISSLLHFITSPDVGNMQFLIKESLTPLLISLLLYVIMNILHQTQESENARSQDEYSRLLITQVTQLREYMSEVEKRMSAYQQEDRKAQEEIREKFVEDIKALDAIQINQSGFLEKFNELDKWHTSVSESLHNFTTVQLPGLDDVIHKHIDILRVAEQDHYNHIKHTLDKAVESRYDISEHIEELRSNINSINAFSGDIAKEITKQISTLTLRELLDVTKEFENQIIALKSHTEGITTSLYEGDNTLEKIKEQSEMLMKQMVLSSNKMNELEKQNNGLHDIYSTLKELISDMEVIKADYVKAQSQLSLLTKELKSSDDEQIIAMKEQIDHLGETLNNKIEESLDKLHEHYHIASENISQSVQVLAKKAQLKNSGYSQLNG